MPCCGKSQIHCSGNIGKPHLILLTNHNDTGLHQRVGHEWATAEGGVGALDHGLAQLIPDVVGDSQGLDVVVDCHTGRRRRISVQLYNADVDRGRLRIRGRGCQ